MKRHREDENETTVEQQPTVQDYVGSIPVSSEDRITCEVCQAEYHKVPGLRNDCPLCNAPGGKVGGGIEAFKTNSTSPMVNALAQSLSLLSGRVATLEQRVMELEHK